MKIYWDRLVLSLAVVFFAGFLGSIVTMPAIDSWYVTLAKPQFNPPNSVFGPVWSLLYVLIGISLYLVWTTKAPARIKKKAYLWFFLQLILNTGWSLIFFGLQSPSLALVEIIILLGAIGATIYYFFKIKRLAAYILIPYMAWVSFATILTAAIVFLN